MSTMDKKSLEELRLEDKKVKENILIINQTNNNQKYEIDNIKMYNYKEKGLSKSRNRAIENSKKDICLIADDDVVYKPNTFDVVKKSFEDNPKADIITFQIETPEGYLFKDYPKEKFWHNTKSILKVSSIEIAFKRKVILKNNIKYDESFGLGAKYKSGEENIFLMDCLKKGLKIKYIPIPIVLHPFESSGKKIDDYVSVASKGALFTRLFGWKFIIINFIFALKKYNLYKDQLSFIKFVKYIYKGSLDYLKERRRR